MKQASEKQLVIYTIGHGNKKIENFIEQLKNFNVGVLVDVRSIPYSRYHPQFRQNNLKESLESNSIRYMWLGNVLGGRPADASLYTNGKLNYEAIKNSSEFADGLKQVLSLAEIGIKVTLMCSESDPNQCHRKLLIADVLIQQNLVIIHITKFDEFENHDNSNYRLSL